MTLSHVNAFLIGMTVVMGGFALHKSYMFWTTPSNKVEFSIVEKCKEVK